MLRCSAGAGGEAAALLQQQPEAPEIFDAPYGGMAAESGGVVGMLEVIQSDFARLESDTSAAEASAQSEYAAWLVASGARPGTPRNLVKKNGFPADRKSSKT